MIWATVPGLGCDVTQSDFTLTRLPVVGTVAQVSGEGEDICLPLSLCLQGAAVLPRSPPREKRDTIFVFASALTTRRSTAVMIGLKEVGLSPCTGLEVLF